VNAQLLTTPQSRTSIGFHYPGTTPTVTANGTTNGVVWAIDNGPPTGSTAVLYAFDASNLAAELYDSNQAINARDQFSHNKFITPLIINGKVYIGTPNSVVVFGLFP